MKKEEDLKEENIEGKKKRKTISGGSISIIYHHRRGDCRIGVSSSATGVLVTPSHRRPILLTDRSSACVVAATAWTFL
jgi:hypothetical protein